MSNWQYFFICLNQVYPGFTWFEQLINFVSSSWFAAKSVEQMRVEQSQFEQFTPTRLNLTKCLIYVTRMCFFILAFIWNKIIESKYIYILFFMTDIALHILINVCIFWKLLESSTVDKNSINYFNLISSRKVSSI